jgi:hypothetical protein
MWVVLKKALPVYPNPNSSMLILLNVVNLTSYLIALGCLQRELGERLFLGIINVKTSICPNPNLSVFVLEKRADEIVPQRRLGALRIAPECFKTVAIVPVKPIFGSKPNKSIPVL